MLFWKYPSYNSFLHFSGSIDVLHKICWEMQTSEYLMAFHMCVNEATFSKERSDSTPQKLQGWGGGGWVFIIPLLIIFSFLLQFDPVPGVQTATAVHDQTVCKPLKERCLSSSTKNSLSGLHLSSEAQRDFSLWLQCPALKTTNHCCSSSEPPRLYAKANQLLNVKVQTQFYFVFEYWGKEEHRSCK